MTIEPPDFQPHLGAQSLVDLFGDAELLEERSLFRVELDAANERGLEALQETQDALVVGLGIHPDGGEVVGHLVAQDALDEVEVVIDQSRRLRGFAALLDVGPEVEEEAEIAAKLLFAGSRGSGADDEAAGRLALFAEKNLFQAPAFAVGLDLARDARVVHRRHEDKEAAGQRDVRGDARALLGDRLLGDLNENLLSGLQQLADGREIGGLHRAAATAAVAASAGALAVACAAGIAGTIMPISPAEAVAASVTTAIAAAAATIVIAAAVTGGSRQRRPGPDRSVGRSFAAFGELFVDDVLFGVGLIQLCLHRSPHRSRQLADGQVVDRRLLLRSRPLHLPRSSTLPERVIWSIDISRSMVPRSAAPSRVSSSSKSSISSMELAWRVVL